jgi:hypothetical protein
MPALAACADKAEPSVGIKIFLNMVCTPSLSSIPVFDWPDSTAC